MEQISLRNDKGTLTQNPQTIANALNDYYSTIAEDLLNTIQTGIRMQTTNASPLPNNYLSHNNPYPTMRLKYTSSNEVENNIKSIKSKDAKGCDGIPSNVLKWCAPYISSPLTYIFNKSIKTGIFPARLKYSTIIPLHKAGDKHNMSNFRPISLLIAFSKVFEKIIYNRTNVHIILNKILTKEQYGFRNNLSTENATFALIH
jgi:hypothetical protein